MRAYRSKDYQIEHYEADLAPDAAAHSVRGDVVIRFTSRVPDLTTVTLDADGLQIEKAREGDRDLPVDVEPGLTRVRLARSAHRGEWRTIRIWYHAQPKRGMWFPAKDWWYTGFHTEAWLPCDASPDDRSTFTLNWRVPTSAALIATGVETARASLPGGIERRTIQLNEPYPAYLVGAVAGPLRTVCARAETIDFCASLDRDATVDPRPALEAAQAAVGPLARWAGIPFPRKRYDQVFLPNPIGGQELVGMALLSERYLREVAKEPREDWLVVHELVHSWWGNLVTCRSWDDFWLNEGLTTFLQAALKSERWGRGDYEEEIAHARRRYDEARRSGKERALSFPGWTTPPDASGPITYSKGALVFELLRHTLGEQAFWTGLRDYTRAGSKAGVTSRDLETAMEKASGRDLRALFESWVYGAATPELAASQRIEGDVVIIEIEQKQPQPIEVPLSIAVETSERRRRVETVLRGRRQEVRVPCNHAALRSVRIDDTATLPVRIAHARPIDMLLFQVAHEPDVVGRVEALDALKSACGLPGDKERCRSLAAPLGDAESHETSRLIRRELRDVLRYWMVAK